LKNKYGSSDYKNAGKMRDIMVKTISEDFTEYLPEIRCPVFLYWGDKDVDTPLWMAKKMARMIPDSGLYIVKGGGHFSFIDDNRIISIIDSFVRT
jgi:pimeloyl-ACP methyl ester carboxylesterase